MIGLLRAGFVGRPILRRGPVADKTTPDGKWFALLAAGVHAAYCGVDHTAGSLCRLWGERSDDPRRGRYILKALLRVLATSAPAQFAAALLLIVLIKWPALHEPPIWDAAMGLFPAAITLAGNGFDLLDLLGMPEYRGGGPNAHSLSVVTFATAGVLRLFGSGSLAYIVLHLLHFSVAAVALIALQRFASTALGPATAWLLCLAALLFPLFSVQVGYLYLEIPLLLCTVAALLAWDRGRLGWAVLWSTLALSVKEAGIIVPAAVVVLAMLEGRRLSSRIVRVLWIAIPSVLWLGLTLLLNAAARPGTGGRTGLVQTFEFGGVIRWLHYLFRFLFNIPDLALFIVVFLIGITLWGKKILTALRMEPTDSRLLDSEWSARRTVGFSAVLICSFLTFFFVALPLAVDFTIVLPRYYVMILPFLLLWVAYAANRLLEDRLHAAAGTCLVLLSAFFLLNTNGRFYPPDVDTEGPGNDFPLAERSNSYRSLNRLQEQAVGYLEAMRGEPTVYYGHYEHYLFNYPELGFSDGPLADGHSLSLEDLDDAVLRDPSRGCLYLLYNYPWLGGEKMLAYLEDLESQSRYAAEPVREFAEGHYVIRVWRVYDPEADCPSRPEEG